MELNNTVEMMNSKDYKERFKAEYLQLLIRRVKLADMIERYEDGALDFTPSCGVTILKAQVASMDTYLFLLKERARIEGIEL